MLRMTPIASAVLLLLLGIDAHAAEETFDTNFMMGGMKGERVSDFRLDDNQPLPGQYDIDIYVNKQGVVSMILLLRIIRMTPVYPAMH